MARIERVKDDPATIALIDLEKTAACAGRRNDRAVVLRAATKYQSIARRHVQVVEHCHCEAVAAILPMVPTVLADVHATIIGIVDESRQLGGHQHRMMI